MVVMYVLDVSALLAAGDAQRTAVYYLKRRDPGRGELSARQPTAAFVAARLALVMFET